MTSEREGATKDRLSSARCDRCGISISSKPISAICDFQITRCFAAGTPLMRVLITEEEDGELFA